MTINTRALLASGIGFGARAIALSGWISIAAGGLGTDPSRDCVVVTAEVCAAVELEQRCGGLVVVSEGTPAVVSVAQATAASSTVCEATGAETEIGQLVTASTVIVAATGAELETDPATPAAIVVEQATDGAELVAKTGALVVGTEKTKGKTS